MAFFSFYQPEPGLMIRFLLLLCLLSFSIHAQHLQSMRMDLIVNFQKQSILLINSQNWVNTSETDTLKLRLDAPYQIKQITVDKRVAVFSKDTVNKLLNILIPQKKDKFNLKITCEGSPQLAKQPPWDGGFIWTKSGSGKNWLTLACQDEGASIWWPAPYRYDDEPDTVTVSVEYPADLFFKGNGRLIKDRLTENRRITAWQTTYPINTYNITLNIGDYVHWSDTIYQADGKKLSLDFYPLAENLEKSKIQFAQSKEMIECFTKAFGPFPFLNDGYSVVETPYAGMEHQSAVAYGNGYENGYSGKDYSGMGLPFDFILIHESAHEWWGNSVSAKNEIDFWLQEAFCTYAEMVYVDCRFGSEKALEYIHLKKNLVKNEAAIIGPDNSGADMYSKGALMIHTMSQFADTKEIWNQILKSFYQEHQISSISTQELVDWFCEHLPGLNPDFFKRYLEFAKPPLMEISSLNTADSTIFEFRLPEVNDKFVLPLILINDEGQTYKTYASSKTASIQLPGHGWKPDRRYSYYRSE